MSHFHVPVRLYMRSPVHRVAPEDSLEVAQRHLSGGGFSSLAVTDPEGRLLGVLTRTDLLRVGRRQAGLRRGAALLTLPADAVAARMSRDVVTVSPEDELESAARTMVAGRLHRVFVVEDGLLVGVLSPRDLMAAVQEKRLNRPVEDFMSSPVFTIRAEEPVSLATDRMAKARVTGLVVVDGGWPVGVFAQREALIAKDVAAGTPVEDVMNPAFLALPRDTKLHRAAAQALALGARRVVVVDAGRVVGILTGIDFARAVA